MNKTNWQDFFATSKKKIRQLNFWKVAFFTLLVLILGTGAFFTSRIFAIREPNYKAAPEVVRTGDPILTISTNKEKVNQVIAYYLEEYLDNSDIQYHFTLENEAMLTGEFEILTFPVTFYLYFDPYVMENGNVQLRAKSLSVGTLNLPVSEVMKMVKRNFKLPEWIEVNSEEQNIMIRLDKFQMANGLFMKANRINLLDDDIQFSLYLPKDKSDKEEE
ncbi:YpmS family protein [Enterococcus asini]|uniref:YpmS family protein n=1 Tax=Enterococcus asini TaxID=57732 RepID=UPI0026DDAD88|nr:YpmS family protein [Enterococcus asini]